MTPLLSLRGAPIYRGDEAISMEDEGDLCIDVAAGFIPLPYYLLRGN
jgi:hypothetical protein